MSRIINEKQPTHWTLNVIHDEGYAFVCDDEGRRGYLAAAIVKSVGIDDSDLGRGFRAYALAPSSDIKARRRGDAYPLITTPLWWDSDQVERVRGALTPDTEVQAVALLKRIEDDLDRLYDLTGLSSVEDDDDDEEEDVERRG